jgi:hypothetical protein
MGSYEDAKRRAGVIKAQRWLGARSQVQKTAMAALACALALLLLYVVIEDHDSLFVMAETVHFVGIGLLAYKLVMRGHTCTLRNPSQTRRPIPLVLNPEPSTLNPQPETRNPKPSTSKNPEP